MILASHANDASKVERYHGQLNQSHQQLGLSKSPRRSLMLSSLIEGFFANLKGILSNNEELIYVAVAFGSGVVAAGVCLILVNIL